MRSRVFVRMMSKQRRRDLCVVVSAELLLVSPFPIFHGRLSFFMASSIIIAVAATVSTLGECRLHKADGGSSRSDGEYQAEASRGTNDGTILMRTSSQTTVTRGGGRIQQIIAHYNIAEIPRFYTAQSMPGLDRSLIDPARWSLRLRRPGAVPSSHDNTTSADVATVDTRSSWDS